MSSSKTIFYFYFLLTPLFLFAQVNQTQDSISKKKVTSLQFSAKQLIIPATLMTYGVVALNNDYLKSINIDIRDEVIRKNNSPIKADDYIQFAPFASVYILNSIGIKGKHNFRDRTLLLGTSFILMTGTVMTIKSMSKIERPDGRADNSFPSGHTATAFAGAEFLWQEYKDESIWYGISGYVVASGTGFLRIYNNRHWLSDVSMGAGIGILSTKIAYWIYPYTHNLLFKSNKDVSSLISPYYNGKQLGVGMMIHYK